MKKVGRTLGVVAAVAGLAVAVTGCGANVIGADGPKPGVAAEVDGSEISLDDLTLVVDGFCTINEVAQEDPQTGAQVQTTSRPYAQLQLLESWIGALVDVHYADDHDLDVSPEGTAFEKVPGWSDLDEDVQDAIKAYAEDVSFASAVQAQLDPDQLPDPADHDIAINPKFDLRPEAADADQGGITFKPAGDQLSVPVGEEASAETTDAPSDDALRSLPDDQLCGKRPAPPGPTAGLPIPQS